ncbi:MAG TPA: DUF1015 family protein [Thermoanaerobaculia bacterium]|nr:DUF1015 family protein [Thermoanaerobaculia bacterium]
MATLKPFRALRPSGRSAAEVSAVPYDVVSTAEARSLASGHPLSFLHVSRAEIDLPDGTDPYADAVYAKAAENFEKLKRSAPLAAEESPSLYVYRLRMGRHEQNGVAGCSSLQEYDRDVVRKHERTRKDKEDDRTRHMLTLKAQTGPVFLTYRDSPDIDALVAAAKKETPIFDFTAPDGVGHTLWRLSAQATREMESAFASVPLFYIADGHHRAASAARARDQLRSAQTRPADAADYNRFLTVLFPASQVRILPYNRVVKDLGLRSKDEFLEELRRRFGLREGAPPSPAQKGAVSVYLGGRWYGITLPKAEGKNPIEALDAHLLERHVLDDLLGIKDIRTDKRIDFVGGIRGTQELEKLVDSGAFAVAFSMYPVSVEELMKISDKGQIMPPKSTWFEPKLRDGLLIHEI